MNIKNTLRNYLLSESYHMRESDRYIDEMAYPSQFNPLEFKTIKSFKGKIDYAKERLLGKLGAGSARAVFKIDDEKVLKVALNKKGIAQNEVESEGYKQNYDVLARVFDIDDDYMWLEMELAKKVTPKRFIELTGTNPMMLGQYMVYTLGKSRYNIPDDIKQSYGENEWIQDLMTFAGDYDYPVPGDFSKITSYGEVMRDGKPTIVVIDFGFSKDVYMNNYGGR